MAEVKSLAEKIGRSYHLNIPAGGESVRLSKKKLKKFQEIIDEKYPKGFPFDGGIIINVTFYNETYLHVHYSPWSYLGEIENANRWYLHPQDQEIKRAIIKISTSKKNKGRYFLDDTMCCRWHIPDKIIKFIKDHNQMKVYSENYKIPFKETLKEWFPENYGIKRKKLCEI